jgi:hypothetical protein
MRINGTLVDNAIACDTNPITGSNFTGMDVGAVWTGSSSSHLRRASLKLYQWGWYSRQLSSVEITALEAYMALTP